MAPGDGRDDFARVAERALEWAREREYTGYNKHDGLNSPLLSRLSFGRKWPRMFAIQAVMRSPVNVRPLVGVRRVRNPKGIALFARAWLDLHAVRGDDASASEARALLDWLVANPCRDFPGMSWGYGYDWQDLGFFAPAGFPNRIVTYFVGRALVHGYEALGDRRYLDAAEQACAFILEAPKVLEQTAETKCVSYVPDPSIEVAVMDVSSLCGALCAMVGKHTGRDQLVDEGRRLVAWVADKQTDYGAWFYTHPRGDSLITHDNYHTGEIVDSLLEYQRVTGDERFAEAYRDGLVYYRDALFTPDWRPKWMNDKQYPYDVHGYAVGILTFVSAGELPVAEAIACAAIEDLWNERDGRFYYQRRRHFTIKLTLMRWCQAWMSHALARLAAARADREG